MYCIVMYMYAYIKRGKERRKERGNKYTESINIHPINGGLAPLYKPGIPSRRSVSNRQSIGPRNCVAVDVCNRTLIVSNLLWDESFLVFGRNMDRGLRGGIGG